jgi:hypothetical protein
LPAARMHAKALGLSDLVFLVEPAPRLGESLGSNVQYDVEGLIANNIDLLIRALTQPNTDDRRWHI